MRTGVESEGSKALEKTGPARGSSSKLRTNGLQYNPLSNAWALLPLRLIIGLGFILHGWAKWSRGPAGFGKLLEQIGVPFPEMTAWAVTLLELAGGFAIIVGALVVLVSIPLIISMLVAIFTVHLKYGFSSINTIGLTKSGPLFGPPGYEVALLYIAGLFALILAGAGPLSIDGYLARREPA
jgi:putative oxidoreductase